MIALLGESASGKSTIEKELINTYGLKKIVSYTTRQPRIGEEDGVDYHFVTDAEFEEMLHENYFAEHATYNNWRYGIAKNDCRDDRVCVITPHGLRMLKKLKELNIYSFYINVPRRDRLIQILKRGDDIEESYRRNISDVGQYDGIEDEVDKVILNPSYIKTPQQICDEIWDEIRHG